MARPDARSFGSAPCYRAEAVEVLSLIALSWFPHIQGAALGRVIGLDSTAPDFLAERKRHVTELFSGWLAARPQAHREAAGDEEIRSRIFVIRFGYTRAPSGGKTGHLNPEEKSCASNS